MHQFDFWGERASDLFYLYACVCVHAHIGNALLAVVSCNGGEIRSQTARVLTTILHALAMLRYILAH